MSPVRCALVLVLALVSWTPAASHAEEEDTLRKARELQEQGDREYRSGDYAAALASYRASYNHVRRPLRLLGMAQCYRQLKRWAEALTHYENYLTEWTRQSPDKDAPYLDEVRQHIARLRPIVEAERRAVSRPTSMPVEAPASAPAIVEPPPADRAERRRKTVIGYSSLGVAVACTVTASVLYGVGLSQRSSAHDQYLAATVPSEMDSHWNDVESAQAKITAGHVVIGLAAVALAVALYELLTRPPAERRPAQVQLLPGPFGATVRATF